ncbi:LamG-like jellyroll fold domain-containing protein [Adhaeribacter rhizoryzae]|uniref:LamG domain-containing protein n=1 Tax=Adhaeribacter rhizoryzae TaxID=2607907 RepID=A0A5M6DAJ1_9BACT|nr:LamG-like jellyroll fold domain-containing protein [Adhaeribacter rhizoryzae]KAA5543302.1 LamG domain-containing protein [Adhaeribacter rhizoryzae]
MKFSYLYTKGCCLGMALAATMLVSCEYDGNPNKLDDVSPADYEGKIDGYTSSEEIYPDNLIAYWSFDDTKNETISNTAPTSTANDSFVAGGVRGKALNLNAGWLYYAKQFENFKTDKLKSFTISHWVQILNNGSKRTMTFQLARPGMFNGNINLALNTNANPASNTDILRIQPIFNTVGGGTQDNLNNNLSPKIGADKWTHIVITYDGNSGVFNIWADGVKVGGFPNRGVGNNLFKAYEPSEVIIGANYNSIPGKEVNTDANFAPMTGRIDEIRVYDIPLPDAHIRSLYNLGKANK